MSASRIEQRSNDETARTTFVHVGDATTGTRKEVVDEGDAVEFGDILSSPMAIRQRPSMAAALLRSVPGRYREHLSSEQASVYRVGSRPESDDGPGR
jgi:hypothetical protein